MLTLLYRRLSGVIFVSIVQNKENAFFSSFSLWGDIIVHKSYHAEYEWIYDHSTFLK